MSDIVVGKSVIGLGAGLAVILSFLMIILMRYASVVKPCHFCLKLSHSVTAALAKSSSTA